ncbi:MAG: glucokinase [Bradymonadia bacterium]|jgi:glucokinase
MRCLLADIGGTNIRLAVYADTTCIARVDTATRHGVLGPIRAMLAAHPGVDRACLAVAGPVVGRRAWLTNVGIELDADALSVELGISVQVINDFHAQALAVSALGDADRHALPASVDAQHPGECLVVVGAGTGLGEALLVPDGHGGMLVVPGEGGHKRFAPRDARARGLLESLTQRFGPHVSVERVVSGPGLAEIHRYLCDVGASADHPIDPARITADALSGRCATCRLAVEMFIDALADEAANLALQCNAGAVYIGGGIAPRILPLLTPRFRAAFEDKGRAGELLKTVPIFVITHPDPGLLGARVAATAS